MSFSKNLRRLRTDRGLTQGGLGKLCGLSESNISHFERETREPVLKNIKRLKFGLNCTYDELLIDNTASS